MTASAAHLPRTTLLDADEVAQQLGVTARAVRNFVYRNEIAAIMVGRLMKFEQGEVDAYKKRRSTGNKVIRIGGRS